VPSVTHPIEGFPVKQDPDRKEAVECRDDGDGVLDPNGPGPPGLEGHHHPARDPSLHCETAL
jgi:hypothetical protein